MCSVGDDNFENETNNVMVPNFRSSADVCNKCRSEKPCVVLRHKDAYCKACFLASAVHKFKALLGKSKLIRINDRVLICHKVGHPSTALLHFLRTGLDLNTHKKLRFKPIVLFIEDQVQLQLDQRKDILKNVAEEAKSFGFDFYCISFTDYLSDPSKLQEHICVGNLQINEHDKENIQNILSKRISKTNKNDIMNLFRRQLLVDCAKFLSCKFIFTPEISADIASDLLTNVALGRGYHIPIDTGFCDDRDEIKILRPLRLFDMKELALYNKFNNLEPITVSRIEHNPYSCIQDLMKKFVNDLQQNFPATITTVMKTGDKLSLHKESTKTCKLCKGGLSEKTSELTSVESTNFSRIVSNTNQDHNVSRHDRYKDVLEKFENQTNTDNEYCFSCSKIKSYIVSSEVV